MCFAKNFVYLVICTMESKEKEYLALKVMRLTRPSLYNTLPIASDTRDLIGDLFSNAQKCDLGAEMNLEHFNTGNLLMLPQSFGNIYLGETFSCYMSVHNDSPYSVRNVSVQADLQIGMQKIMLIGHRNDSSLITELKPDDSVDDVIHHEVKEIGTHILACTVSYITENDEKKHFRKFFKFQVSKPLDVKTKFYNAESDEVYLEAQLQNITSSPMCLEKVVLEPSVHFTSRQLNTTQHRNGGLFLQMLNRSPEPKPDNPEQKHETKTQPIFGEVNCLNPLDSCQYLFCLTPKPETQANIKLLKGVTSIGKLDIVWRTSMGERGRLQTSQLERMAPGYGEIRLNVEEIPSIVQLEKSFTVGCRVINTCDRRLNLTLRLNNTFSNGLLWQGVSGHQLGELLPHSSILLNLEAIPIKTGLLVISGIRLTDVFLKRTYDYDDIAQVFVCSEVPSA